jgi:hypothetical protein
MEWTPENKLIAVELICSRVMFGESIRSILNDRRDKEVYPNRKDFYEWVSADKQLCDQYARAMEIRMDDMAEDTLQIADGEGDDIITLPDGREFENQKVIARDRLKVDTRKWLMSKMYPKKYGEKISQELTGKDGKDLIPERTIIVHSKEAKDALKSL